MCATEALAHARRVLSKCMSEHKSVSLGNAATSRSTIRNTHGITLGSLKAARDAGVGRSAYLGNPNWSIRRSVRGFTVELSHAHVLAIACKKKFVLDEYIDDAVGHMEKNAEGRLAITRVTLRQRLKFTGENNPRRRNRGDESWRTRAMLYRELGEHEVKVEAQS